MKLRTYNRAELEELFHTSRTDSIKRSLERAGYTFESQGRGQGYTITITALPEPLTPFETFAKREFGSGPQTNFDTMQKHFFLLFYDEEYPFLPSNHQAQFLKENYDISISDQSLRNWQKLLFEREWIVEDSGKVKYYLCRKGEPPREITEEEYKRAWHTYYDILEGGGERSQALHEICALFGGMPRKQCGFAETAWEQDKLDKLKQILTESV